MHRCILSTAMSDVLFASLWGYAHSGTVLVQYFVFYFVDPTFVRLGPFI